MPIPERGRRQARAVAAVVAVAALAGGCAGVEEASLTAVADGAGGPRAPLPAPAPAPPPGRLTERVSPLRDPRGLHPGLTPVAPAERGRARRLIATLRLARPGPRRGYDRERVFGTAWKDDVDVTWGHDGCRTREQILTRDLRAVEFRAGTGDCVVLEGTLQEPYTGRTIFFSKARPMEVQVDHVIPLAYAWSQGARSWSQARREQFAGDPLNLLAVDGPSNASKSDRGPSRWRPPNARVRCAYAVRFAQAARRYALPLVPADVRAMARACGGDRA